MSRKTLYSIKALILILLLVRERGLTRDLSSAFARARVLASEFALASAFASEFAHVYDLAYQSGRQHDHEESK